MAQDNDSKPTPLLIGAGILAAAAVIGGIAYFVSRPPSAASNDAQVQSIVKQIQGPATAPTVSPARVQTEVMTRGAKKNTGQP